MGKIRACQHRGADGSGLRQDLTNLVRNLAQLSLKPANHFENPSSHLRDDFDARGRNKFMVMSGEAAMETRLYSGRVRFVLSASGHMAGVISAPGSKYGHWTNDNLLLGPDEWFADATPHQGSWWPVL